MSNAYIEFAKDTITRMDGQSQRSDTAQAMATVAIAGALIGLAEVLEQGLTNQR